MQQVKRINLVTLSGRLGIEKQAPSKLEPLAPKEQLPDA